MKTYVNKHSSHVFSTSSKKISNHMFVVIILFPIKYFKIVKMFPFVYFQTNVRCVYMYTC
jgi:hypothetical protein